MGGLWSLPASWKMATSQSIHPQRAPAAHDEEAAPTGAEEWSRFEAALFMSREAPRMEVFFAHTITTTMFAELHPRFAGAFYLGQFRLGPSSFST